MTTDKVAADVPAAVGRIEKFEQKPLRSRGNAFAGTSNAT